MFTQRISMDCTKEQYEKYLKDDLLKMGYQESILFSEPIGGETIIVNNSDNNYGELRFLNKVRKSVFNRTYLGQFNAPLFLAFAAMTNEKYGGYGEYWVFEGNGCAPAFICGNLYKAITPINKDWCFIDEMGDENSFSDNEKYFRKATVSEIMQKFGEPKKEGKTISIEISCDFTRLEEEIMKLHNKYTKHIKGEYYYCKSGDTEWVFISSGDKKHKTDFFCTVNFNSGFFDTNCYITPDNDIDYIRLATNDEKDILNKKLAEKGKYFDKEKCKIMPIVDKFQDLSEDTAQELLRLTNKLWKDVEDYHIKWLKERGYKILKTKTWEEV